MRICHVYGTACFESGGIVRYIYDQGRGLAHREHEVVLCTGDSPTELVQIQKAWGDGVKIHPISMSYFTNLVLRSKPRPHIAELIEKSSVVHFHCIWSPFALSIARYAASCGVPYVITLHGMLDDWCMTQRRSKKQFYLKVCARTFIANATAVITSTAQEREQAKKWLPKSRIEVVPPVMDLSPYQKMPSKALARSEFDLADASDDRPVILFLSRIHEKKGADILIEAMKILQTHYPRSTLIIAGVGEENYVNALNEQIKSLGLESIVKLVGMVDGELKASLYAVADVFALPTAQENFGLVFTESMACGTPVLTSSGIDLCDDLERSGGAILCDRTPEHFALALKQMLDDREKREEMGKRGREWVFENFSEDHILNAHETLYQNIADGSGFV